MTNCRNPLLFGEVIRGNGFIKMYFGLYCLPITGEHVHIELIQLSGDYKGNVTATKVLVCVLYIDLSKCHFLWLSLVCLFCRW